MVVVLVDRLIPKLFGPDWGLHCGYSLAWRGWFCFVWSVVVLSSVFPSIVC